MKLLISIVVLIIEEFLLKKFDLLCNRLHYFELMLVNIYY